MAATKPKKAAGTKKPKAAKEPKTPKAATASASPPKIFNTPMDEENRKLFLNVHLPKIKLLKEKQARATADLRNGYKTAKAEGGFTKEDFETAINIEDAEREAKTKARIARQLVIARYCGKSLGAQLEMFLEPDRTPSSDIAFVEGKQDAITNKPAKPGYDPSTEQHRRYMEGYHSVSEERVTKGITKLHPEIAADQAAKDAAAAKRKADQDKDAAAFEEKSPPPKEEITSGVPTSRAQFLAAQQREQAEGSAFSKKN